MDRDLLVRHLAQSKTHIALGELHIAQQKATIAHLRAAGRPTDDAQQLLDQFEELQSRRESHHDWLVAKLAEIC